MLLLSVAGHATLLLLGTGLFRHEPPIATPKEPIEITEVPQEWLKQAPAKPLKPNREQQVVESEKTNNDKIDPNAKFLSEKNQTAEKQTRAKLVDDFRQKKGTGAKSGNNEVTPKTGDDSGAESKQDKIAIGEIPPEDQKKTGGVKRDWKSLSLKDLGIGGDGSPTAATDDRLEGIELGDQTVLSTREFKYYSYYNRIKELLRQYWKPNIERQLAMLWAKGKQLSDAELVTKLLILLDEKGNLTKISKLSGSGIIELDQAAVEAFRRAAPFPNPPHGLVDADGFVRVRWDFILQTVAGPRIQFHPAGVQ
jgi:protein TonB